MSVKIVFGRNTEDQSCDECHGKINKGSMHIDIIMIETEHIYICHECCGYVYETELNDTGWDLKLSRKKKEDSLWT